ncbi:MAG: ribosome recycling factor [candidate division WOR-3 bacterium]
MLEEKYKQIKEKMQKSVDLFSLELSRIRTARANPAILDDVKVDYYGTLTPLKQLASISVPEPRQLLIQPWDRSAIPEIEKAILKSELGLNPIVETNLIRIPIPPLTEERRKELVKLCHKLSEDAKIAIRNIRRDGNEDIKKLEKDKKISEDDARIAQKKIQDFTDEFIKTVDKLFAQKEKEIMER